MTTTTTATAENVETSLLPSLFNIQYPNCSRGMFSLREPFKNMPKVVSPTVRQPASTRIVTPAAVQPTYLNTDQVTPKQEEPIPVPRQVSKRNAEVQCLLLTPTIRHDRAVQTQVDRQRTAVNYSNDDNDFTPRHRIPRKLRPVKQYEKVYEIWDIKSAPVHAIPINHRTRRRDPQARHTRNRKPIIDYVDDYDDEEENEKSDYEDERILYARQSKKIIKKTYLPPNVRMICVRDDANRASY